MGQDLADLSPNPNVRVVAARLQGLDHSRDPGRGRAVGDGVDHVAADPWIGIPRQLEQPRPHPVVVGPDVAGAEVPARELASPALLAPGQLEQTVYGIPGGLLVAAFFAAALSSKAAELNALGSSTTVDFYRQIIQRDATDAHCVVVSKWLTAFWGLVAIGFALYAHLVENLIQAVNILGSIFYGVMLGLFVVAFFVRHVGGTAVFWSALVSQTLVFVLYFTLTISYLWYPLIGCAACVILSIVLQKFISDVSEKSKTPET